VRIGFLGLGIMGSRMAANLVRAGHALTVHSRRRVQAETLLEMGARWADTPIQASEGAEAVLTMLPHPEDVQVLALAAYKSRAATPLAGLAGSLFQRVVSE
jgi:3-hydroxyisobutyrate dehydrogenase-like beta-hydroxyacid dehydrogenase